MTSWCNSQKKACTTAGAGSHTADSVRVYLPSIFLSVRIYACKAFMRC